MPQQPLFRDRLRNPAHRPIAHPPHERFRLLRIPRSARLPLAMLALGGREDFAEPRDEAPDESRARFSFVDRWRGLGDFAIELVTRAAGGNQENVH